MGIQARFLEIKEREFSQEGENNTKASSVCEYLKSIIKDSNLDSDDCKLREEFFEDKLVSFIIDALDPTIATILEEGQYLLGKNTSIYLVDKVLWQAIKEYIKKEFNDPEKTFSSITKESKEMEEIEKLFNDTRLAIEAS